MQHRALIAVVVWTICWLVFGCESDPEFTDPGARLEYHIRKRFDERLRSFKVNKISGKWFVAVEFKSAGNFTTGMIRGGIEIDMIECFRLIYSSENPIERANIKAYMGLMDRYGNSFETVVYETTMLKRTAEKINWDNKFILNLSDLVFVDFMHPVLIN